MLLICFGGNKLQSQRNLVKGGGMEKGTASHRVQVHHSLLFLYGKILSVTLTFVLVMSLFPLAPVWAAADTDAEGAYGVDVTTTSDNEQDANDGYPAIVVDEKNNTPVTFEPGALKTLIGDTSATLNASLDTTGYAGIGFMSTLGELGEPTVTFLVGGVEYERYTIGDGLTEHVDGVDVYYISDAAPSVSLPADKVSFRGWFLEGDEDPFDFGSRITESIVLTAKFSETYLISFKDGDGKVVYTREYLPGAHIYPPDATVMDQIDQTAPAGKHFEYWYVEGDSSEASFFLTGPEADSDLTLVPLFGNYWYVIFVSAGDEVDNPVQLVRDGEYATQPSNPTRLGYDFIHWSETVDGAEFLFTTPIAHNTNLYAVWNPELVAYTVAIWMEKPNIEGTPSHPGGSKTQYNYVTSIILQGRAWTWSDVNNSMAEILGVFATDPLLRYAEFQDVEQQLILGNGLTVVSLYAKRKIYTYEFDLGASSSNTMYIAANNITYSGGTGAPRYKLEFKYEMEIAGKLPVQGLPSVAVFSPGFASWTRPTALRWESTANIASIRNFVDKSMIAEDGKQLSYTLAAAWTATGSSYNYRYFMEALPGQLLTPQNSITLNGRTYIVIAELNQAYQGNLSQKQINGLTTVSTSWVNGSTTYEWLPYNYSVAGGYSAAAQNAAAVSSTTVCRCFFYLRNSFPLNFYMMASALDVVTNAPVTPQSVKYQESLAAYEPAIEPGREGFIFAGWFRDSDYQEPFDFDGLIMPNGPMSVYAKWEFDVYILTFFDGLGGKVVDKEGVADGAFATHSIYTYGLAYEGYGEFLGWYYLLSGKLIPFNYDIPIRSNYHLYAAWKTDGFKVIYSAGEGTGTVPVNTTTYELGTEMRAEAGSGLTGPDGKVFYAWLSSTNGKLYYPGSIVPIFGTTTLTAQYASLSDLVTITYVENFNGSVASINYPAVKNEAIILQGEIFTQGAGYRLIGWADVSDALAPDYALSEPDYMVTTYKTFYGVWEAITYTVIFDPGTQGTWTVASETYTGRSYGSAIPQFNRNTASDHNPGYTFIGWLEDTDDGPVVHATLADLPAFVTGDVTYIAQWAPLFKVTFYDWDGTVLSVQYVLYGQDATAPASPTRTGYNFLWWDKGYTNVTADLDVYAVYAPITVPPPTTETEEPGEEAPPEETPPPVTPPPVTPPPSTTQPPTPQPPAPQPPAPTVQPIDDPLTKGIGDQQTPLFVRVSWALVNLILMILDVIIMLVLLITYFRKRKEDADKDEVLAADDGTVLEGALNYDYKTNDEYKQEEQGSKKRLWPRLLTIFLALASIILFFLFEDMRLPMVYTNQWTIWHFVIFVLVVVCVIVTRFRKDTDEDEGQKPAPQAPQTPAYPLYGA